ncbi:ABC transporter permease subunit [Streptomyces sp. cmx-18-6]|uniref:ABC transporter permease subunit n=1 Tax=Streptomyces sp. cmx-18-6 TaxID=2790930 RepID=UPI00397FC9B1
MSSSNTTVTEAPGELAPRRRVLHGLTWLVVRQHRAALYCMLGVTALCSLWILYERHELVQLIDAAGGPDEVTGDPIGTSRGYDFISSIFSLLPLVFAVLIGAPLIAGDQENGTAQLVTTQSVTRRRWLIAKLALAYSLALASGALLSFFFTWWWEPHRSLFSSKWMENVIFDNTGPVLPAYLLFVTAAAITIGVLVRRVLPAMVATFLFTMIAGSAWNMLREHLAPSRMFAYPLHSDLPARFSEIHELDRWIGSADGRLYGWGSCAEETEAAQNACIKDKGIVNDVIEYLDYNQMAAMQWTGAGILLAGTVLLTAVTLWRGSRRPL